MAEHLFHRPKAAAEMLDLKVDQIYALIAAGTLGAIDVSANRGHGRPRWRISQEALDRFVSSRSTHTPQVKRIRRWRGSTPVKEWF